MRQTFASLLVLGALAFLLAACGGGKDNSAASGQPQPSASEEIVVKASNWKFDKAEYIIPKDKPVKITLQLDGGHGMKVTGTDIDLGPGNESTVVTLKEGTYEFKCSIRCGTGHNDMKSKLIVK